MKRRREGEPREEMPEAMGTAREGKAPRRHESSSNPAAGGTTAADAGPPAPFILDSSEEDECLRTSSSLSREELLRRRSRRRKQLCRIYRQCYWSMMEDIRVKHRDFYWEFGDSPVVGEEEEEEEEDGGEKGPEAEVNGSRLGVDGSETLEDSGRARSGVRSGLGEGEGGGDKKSKRKRCAFAGCKSKAMPLTSFCHPHILSDKKQTLYKACSYLTRSSGPGGPITCGKPILRVAMPSLCHVHLQKHQRSVTKAFRKAAVSLSSSGRPAAAYRSFVYSCLLHIRDKRNC